MEPIFRGLLLVSDFDGTLAAHGSYISEKNDAAIRRFIELGGRFTISTGRAPGSICERIGQIPVNAPLLCSNGSTFFERDRGKVLWCHPIETGLIHRIVREVYEQFPGTAIEIFENDTLYLLRRNSYSDRHTEMETAVIVPCTPERLPQVITKVIFVDENAALQKVRAHLVRQGHEIEHVFTYVSYLELMKRGVDKGSGLREIAEYLGIEREKTAAVGDYYNDIPMLRQAALGAAVANALPEVREAADVVVCSNAEGAVAEVIAELERRVRSGLLG
ncbi:Cof-type HAD-IIB family hydrolase [Feifania hominis]|uniref:Cof-type HAD-IIB family hydrolase n=1 Tax=Feifania hominis TaxID=2763660 RepID=A0A926HVB9_9FIRM|nr:Cof-type HAD-IIB family hydrolase [Feifania hominis]MBC8536825.1 Cof-type HAD-IIB family hydrolase [Feifania hominis]